MAMSIPGIVPHSYTTDDRLQVEWSSHLTSCGNHKVIVMDDGEPRFVHTNSEFYGLSYSTVENF